jgi:hypothetical protein
MGYVGRFSHIVVILFLTSVRLAFGQAPTIDDIYVDERNGDIIIHGNLGGLTGSVFIDSLPLNVVYWSDSVCKAEIPISGRGSAGLVEVGANGYRSEAKILSSIWILHSHQSGEDNFATGDSHGESYNYREHFRVDIEDNILKNQSVVVLQTADDSKFKHYYRDFTNGLNTEYTDTGTIVTTSNLYLYTKVLGNYKLEHDFKPKFTKLKEEIAHSHSDIEYYCDAGSAFLPRQEYLDLTYIPVIQPKFAEYKLGDTVKLTWSTAAPITASIVIATDSLFQSIILDSMIASSSITFDNIAENTNYFWRVCSKNSVGRGPWSDVGRFRRLGDMAVLKDDIHLVSVTPNPMVTSAKFTFNLDQDAHVRLKIFDLYCHEVGGISEIMLPNGHNELQLNLGNLSSSIYFYSFEIDNRVISGKFLIKR